LGSIMGYAIKYIPTIWEKPLDSPNVPTYEKFIVINLSYGEWLMVLIIVLIFLSISKLYEEKQPKALPSTEEKTTEEKTTEEKTTEEKTKKKGWRQFWK